MSVRSGSPTCLQEAQITPESQFTKLGSLGQESLDELVLYAPCKHGSHLRIHQAWSGFLGFLNL